MISRLAALMIACFGAGCASTDPATPAQPVRLRILSYNIHHGEGTDGKLDLERIARIIRGAEPDLVALQEVDDRAQRTGGVNQTAELARLTGLHAVFGQAMVFQGGGYGQAVLSRWPILLNTVHTLPQEPRREPRIALVIRTRAGENGPELWFGTTHFDHELAPVRQRQAGTLNSLLAAEQTPVILAGDFNAVPESAEMQVFWSGWADAAAARPEPTIPAERPSRRIDYVLLHPRHAWRVVETRVLDEPVASDHRPVLAVVELLAPRPE